MAEPSMTVGLVQINNSFSNQNYLPLSVGLLQAYAQTHLQRPERVRFLLPLYTRVPVERAVQHLEEADIVFFSLYVWNFRISVEVAKALKQRKPNVIVVFGGPHVPDRDETLLQQYPFLDLACHGEGEVAATAILGHAHSQNWEAVPSISYRRDDATIIRNPKAPRIKDLGVIPSPYLEHVFAPLMEANPQEHWVALWETNRGCPFSCTFCDWGSATQSKVSTFELERLYREVEWFADRRIEFVFCCDANYGMLPRDIDITRYMVETKRRLGYPHAFSVQNTKNATERAYQVQKLLSDAEMNKGVTIALQSMDPAALKYIKRDNISLEMYQELQRRFTRDGVETYTDMILGLPGETYESFADGVSTIIANGQHNRIQFNNLSILPNAEMGDPEYQRAYGMILVETKIINIHGSLAENAGEIEETQELVVGTATMPKPVWVRTRAFSWMTALLHFDKIVQIPLVFLHELCGLSYRELIEAVTEGDLEDFPILAQIRQFFLDKALDIQQGGSEYCQSTQWLNIWWPADEYILIKLCVEHNLPRFYQEIEYLYSRVLEERFLSVPPRLLAEAVELNRSLFKIPFQTEDLELTLSYNIWEFYRSVLIGSSIPLEEKPCRHRIDRTSRRWATWDDWCREVIWYGNKKGAYLYGNNLIEPQLAGHF